jgi:hypothetical protein
MYGHWIIQEALMKIDAIQKERHAVGIPVITLPPGATNGDVALAEEIGRNLRTNERAHVVLPDPNWTLEWASMTGSPVSPEDSLNWHTEQIYANAMWRGTDDNSYDIYMKSVRHIADRIADTLNKWVVRELIDFNWGHHQAGHLPAYPGPLDRRVRGRPDPLVRRPQLRRRGHADPGRRAGSLAAQGAGPASDGPRHCACGRVPPKWTAGRPGRYNRSCRQGTGRDQHARGADDEVRCGEGARPAGRSARQSAPAAKAPQRNAGTDRSGSSGSR